MPDICGTEWRYSSIKREALGIFHGLERFCHYCFAREVSIFTYHKQLVVIFKKEVLGSNPTGEIPFSVIRVFQKNICIYIFNSKRCCNTVTKNTMYSPQDTPILSQNIIQAWTRSFHCRLAVQTQPHREQRCRNTWHGYKGGHNTDKHRHHWNACQHHNYNRQLHKTITYND